LEEAKDEAFHVAAIMGEQLKQTANDFGTQIKDWKCRRKVGLES
jgi:hypothetical protein